MTNGIETDHAVSPLDREQIAHVEVGHTNITSTLARALVIAFLVLLATLPLIEFGTGAPGAQGALGAQGAPGAPGAAGASGASGASGAWRSLVQANRGLLARMSAYESALEDQSAIGRALRPPTQLVLSGRLGAGNERVYVGRDGWLFYRPDVEYLTGRGFLDPDVHARRIATASEYEVPPQPDPRPAILQFKRDLDARGITLVLVPTPVKPAIHPERLGEAIAADHGVLRNASYRGFIDELTRAGVLVFDAADEIARTTRADTPGYLATDTHWRPETMQRVAEALAAFVQEQAALPALTPAGYAAERREARQAGDTAAMLDLPEGQTLYPPERVPLRFIVDREGNPWRSSRDADVLLLGDSFANIYSLATMGWGEAAGLGEQLSFALQRPVDRIIQNDQGAHATRSLLARDPDRLTGKRVVIWQFAARELAFGDWKVIEMPR
jgi:alginate O-acetyltransferase complex protein AlgJ